MRHRLCFAFLAALLAGLLPVCPTPANAQGPPGAGDPPPVPGVDVQARGPVHEAFAEPTNAPAAPGPVVVKEPPPPIEEAPPEEKPAGDTVVWIPGYWNWDEEARDYLWISGFWRATPPGRSWTPGHWQKAAAGYQWVSGFWGQPGAVETEYLPTAPPATLDRGPTTPAPSATSTYAPGIWVYQTNRYLWRPGYWVAYRPGWVWTPSFYRWTPSGYIYVAGFWDLPLLDRGLLFAPVRFNRTLLRARFVYQPTYVIQPDFLVGALFVRTGAPAFYFGNYFEPRYQRTYVSWINYRVNRTVVDGNFSYYRAAYNGHPEWERNLKTLYLGRYNGTIGRPPATLVLQTKAINNITIARTATTAVHKNFAVTHLQNVTVLQPIKKMTAIHVTAMASLAASRPGFAVKAAPIRREVRVERLSKDRMLEERRAMDRYRAIANGRRTAEAKVVIARPTPPGASPAAPVKVKVVLPRETPPARVIRHLPPPPPPSRPKVDPRHLPKKEK